MKIKKIAIQGIEASFHHEAALLYFGNEITIYPCLTFEQLVNSVESGICAYGIMAIENTLAGSLLPNYQLLLNSNTQITGEVFLRISQNFMVMPGQKFADIKSVHSHPIALQQCKPFMENYPHILLIQEDDTSLCAKEIAACGDLNKAAIASKQAASAFGLEIIAHDIQTHKNNATRFLIIQKKTKVDTKEHNKATLSFCLHHEVGSLATILTDFAKHGLNLTKIQSFPIIETPGEYRFYVDMEFEAISELNIALSEIQQNTSDLRILGTFSKTKKLTNHDN